MKPWLVEYDENNSGARWRMKDEHWDMLRSNGWDLYEKGRRTSKMFKGTTEDEARRAAVDEWQDLTGLSASDPGCDCCGIPHKFFVEPMGDTTETLEEITGRTAGALKKLNMDGRTSCAHCSGSLKEPYPGMAYCPACE